MLRKGDAVLVEGRIATRGFRDKDGNDRSVTEIVVSGWQGTVNILSRRRPESDADGGAGAEDPGSTACPGRDPGSGAEDSA